MPGFRFFTRSARLCGTRTETRNGALSAKVRRGTDGGSPPGPIYLTAMIPDDLLRRQREIDIALSVQLLRQVAIDQVHAGLVNVVIEVDVLQRVSFQAPRQRR